MRGTPHRHDLSHGKSKRHPNMLGNHGNPSRYLPSIQPVDTLSEEPNLSPARPHQSRKYAN
jgi:hypothetical protein